MTTPPGSTRSRCGPGRAVFGGVRGGEAVVTNIREAIKGYVIALQDDGLPVPEERSR